MYDWIHARTAKVSAADLILTRDEDFVALSKVEGISTDWP